MILTKNDFKSPHICVLYAVFIALSICLLIYSVNTNKRDYLLISLGILIFLGVLFLIGFTNRIKIEHKGITQSSLSKDYLLNWKDIKTVGVYRINRFGVEIIEPKKYDSFSLLGQNFIYVSDKPNHKPRINEKTSRGFIHFHYRKEAWEEIEKYFDKN